MAIPLKTGADLYNNELLRARLHNHPADALDEYGVGSFYFNNSSGLNSSDRMRYRGLTAWHSVANMEDIEDVKDLIKALSGSSSESVASVLGRVITLEGYFSNGKAKDADLLDGHNSDYFATASGLSALQEKVSAFFDGEADSDAVLENLKEIQAFLDSYDGATSLADMFGAVNTQIADRYTKAEADARYLQLTGGIVANTSNAPLKIKTDSESAWVGIEYLNNLGEREGSIGVYGGKPIFVPAALDKIWTILHSGNYSDLITALNGNLSVGGNLTASGNSINLGNADSVTAIAGTLSVNKSATFKENVFFTSAEGIYINSTSINWGKEFGFVSPLINFAANQITVKQKATIEGDLYVTGHIIADGQVSSGGIGSEGSGGASGIIILEDWEKYDDTLAQVLGAGLGVGLRDKIAALESKATNVSVAQTLTSGKEIGAITIDGVATKLFAPDDYLPLSGGTLTGDLNITAASQSPLEVKNTAQEWVGLGFAGKNNSGYAFITYTKNEDGSEGWGVTNDGWTKVNSILHSGNFNSYALPLTGGTITAQFSKALTLAHDGSGSQVINFANAASGDLGGLGVSSGKTPIFFDTSYIVHQLLHSGNFNTYAPTLTGTGASGTWGIDISGSAAKLGGYSAGDYFRNLRFTIDNAEKLDAIDKSFNGVMLTSNYSPIDGIYGYGQLIQFADITGTTQIYIADWNNGVYVRNSWLAQTKGFEHEWKQLAYTTSNVASATKLATARSLWGNTFDGTADINGDIHLAADKGIVASNGYAVLTAPSYLLLGYAQSELGQTTYLDGNDIYLRYGKNHVPAMYINSSGNVTIGASDLASVNHRLYVSGGLTRINSGLQVKGHTSFFAEANDAYVTSFYTHERGLTIQPRIEDVGYTNIILNPSGGNVGIGTTAPAYRLDVNGNVNISSRLLVGNPTDSGWVPFQVKGAADIDGPLYISSHSKEGIYFNENGVHWHNTSAGWVSALMEFSSSAVRLSQPTTIAGDLRVEGNIIADGQVSSGGVAEAGTGGATGGSGLDRVVFTIPKDSTSFSCEHNLGTREISVTIYEEGNDYQQVLADVYLDSTNIARVVFGSATDVVHKVVIIG